MDSSEKSTAPLLQSPTRKLEEHLSKERERLIKERERLIKERERLIQKEERLIQKEERKEERLMDELKDLHAKVVSKEDNNEVPLDRWLARIEELKNVAEIQKTESEIQKTQSEIQKTASEILAVGVRIEALYQAATPNPGT